MSLGNKKYALGDKLLLFSDISDISANISTMSRLYDTIEPSVIDDEMLHKAVEEQGPKEEAGRIAKQEGIDFADVLALRLDYKNILKIDNLWCFTALTKLQLDNNIIERIEGLDHLVNLVWLG